jgi:hypothetical protein
MKIGNYICSSGTVHQLVYEAWVGLRKELQINHIDGNKANNYIGNLELVTPSQNVVHAHSTGLASGKSGSTNSMAKLSTDAFDLVVRQLKQGLCNTCIGDSVGLHPRYVSLIRGKKRWKSFLTGFDFPKSNKYECAGCTATTIPEGSNP